MHFKLAHPGAHQITLLEKAYTSVSIVLCFSRTVLCMEQGTLSETTLQSKYKVCIPGIYKTKLALIRNVNGNKPSISNPTCACAGEQILKPQRSFCPITLQRYDRSSHRTQKPQESTIQSIESPLPSLHRAVKSLAYQKTPSKSAALRQPMSLHLTAHYDWC